MSRNKNNSRLTVSEALEYFQQLSENDSGDEGEDIVISDEEHIIAEEFSLSDF